MPKLEFHPSQLDAKGLLSMPRPLWVLLWWLMRYPIIWLGSLMGGQAGGRFLEQLMPDFEKAWPWLLPALPALLCLWLNGHRQVDGSDKLWWCWRQQGWLLKLTLVGDLGLIVAAIIKTHGRYDPWLAIQLAVTSWGLVYLLSSKYLPLLWRDRPRF
ncbi:DUF2919 family protein [Gallaecimonas kandeliae]|uniref:DUF2919 family protein n=1 Tax=Gallaecimonas kandeliae TaxID=3029055 RepID=UPI00264877BA|nr:DUF2919 family protein [Gallaecimonas kandeliae]WKE64283.1 DUF2919 family protein [Gallaecimonas kandeliae]